VSRYSSTIFNFNTYLNEKTDFGKIYGKIALAKVEMERRGK
jgi:hypothetical protein